MLTRLGFSVCSLMFLVICSCSMAIDADKKVEANITTEIAPNYKGWNFLVDKLITDKVSKESIFKVFGDQRMPEISFIPFKLNPVESTQIYDQMTALERLNRADDFLKSHQKTFKDAESKFAVSKYVIAGIISVETNWGSFTGNEMTFYRLARIVSTADANNLEENFKKLSKEDKSVSFEQVKARSSYLVQTFYPQILALFRIYKDNPENILGLKGSSAGAFGLPQFLPKSYEDYAVDGNGDNKIDLFNPDDAIYSVASFLNSHGWQNSLLPKEKLNVLWHYNRSEAYGRAIIRVALSLQNREINYN